MKVLFGFQHVQLLVAVADVERTFILLAAEDAFVAEVKFAFGAVADGAFRMVVQLLQIQEVHPGPHSSACNFVWSSIYKRRMAQIG